MSIDTHENSTSARWAAPESPLRELLRQALPSMAAMLSYTAMQFIDARMVAELGALPLAAQGNGGVAAWFPIATSLGVLFIVNTYVAQNLGAGRPREGAAYAWNGLWLGLIAWLFTLPYGAALGPIFRLMGEDGHDPELVRLETEYAQILIAGGIFWMWSRAIGQFFYGVHRPMVVLTSTVASNIVNIGLNYVLIFGKLGFPAMGVRGAAIATVIAASIELAIPMALFLSKSYDRDYGTRSAWRWSWPKARNIIRVGWPGGVQQGNEMFCWWIFMAYLIGSFGTAHNTAAWIGLRWMTVGFMPIFGLQQAVTAVVGRQIGRGDLAAANQRAWLGVKVAMAYMAMCAASIVVLREPMIHFFIADTVDPEVREEIVHVGSWILVCCAVFQLFDALGIVLMGALRGAGDTIWPGVVTMILSWTLILGVGWLFVTVLPGLGAIGPWIAATLYIAALSVATWLRWQGGRWKTIALVAQDGLPEAPKGDPA